MTDDSPAQDGERVVRCPVEGCNAEKLARGIHLHILQSSDAAHGEQGEVPEEVSLDDLEEVGREKVEVDYPDDRDSESVARLCPYCSKPFKGKNGVLIHLGAMAGRKNHPPNASDIHESADFPVVELDEDENIVSVLNSPGAVDEADPSERSDEGERPDEMKTFATFTKPEFDYLCEVFYKEIEDDRLNLLLQRKFFQTPDCD